MSPGEDAAAVLAANRTVGGLCPCTGLGLTCTDLAWACRLRGQAEPARDPGAMGFSPETTATVRKLTSTVAAKIHVGGKKLGSPSIGESCRAVSEAEPPRGRWAGE